MGTLDLDGGVVAFGDNWLEGDAGLTAPLNFLWYAARWVSWGFVFLIWYQRWYLYLVLYM